MVMDHLCRDCASPLEQGQHVCPHCGAAQDGGPADPPPQVIPPPPEASSETYRPPDGPAMSPPPEASAPAPVVQAPPVPTPPPVEPPGPPPPGAGSPYQPPGSAVEGNVNWIPYDPDRASTQAIIAMVLGLLSLCCCGCFVGIPGFVLGYLEYRAINENRSSPKGLWMAWVAMILGGLSILLTLFGLVLQFAGAIMEGF